MFVRVSFPEEFAENRDTKVNDVKERIVYHMKAMNGITNELREKKARRNWQTRCGAFLLGVVAAWSAAYPSSASAELTTGINDNQTLVNPIVGNNGYSLNQLSTHSTATGTVNFYGGTQNSNILFEAYSGSPGIGFLSGSGEASLIGGTLRLIAPDESQESGTGTVSIQDGAIVNFGSQSVGGALSVVGGNVNVNTGGLLRVYSDSFVTALGVNGTGIAELNAAAASMATFSLNDGGTIRLNGSATNVNGLHGTGGTIDTNSYNIIFTSDNNSTQSGIDDGFDLVKTGSGTMTLRVDGGSGTKTIAGGTIRYTNPGSLGSGDIIFTGQDASAATLYKEVSTDNSGGNFDNNIVVSGSDAVGTFYVDTARGATDYMGSGATTINFLGSLTGEGTFVKSGGATMYIGYEMSDVDGSVASVATNPYFFGDFKVDGGTVVAGSALGIGANSSAHSLIIGKGVYVADYSDTPLLRGVELTNSDNNGSLYGIGTSSGRELTLSGIVSGTGNLNKYGQGTLILGNTNNSYRGSTGIDDGVLVVSSGAHLGNTSVLYIGMENDSEKTPVFRVAGDSTIRPDIVVGNANSTIETTSGITATSTGNISGSGNLHKTGEGTLSLKGNGQNVAGEYFIDAGTLMIDNAANINRNTLHLGNASASTNGKATLLVSNGNNVSLTNIIELAPSLPGNGGASMENIIQVDSGSSLSLAGPIYNAGYSTGSGQAADLHKAGGGTLILEPTSSNKFTGTMFVDEGTLVAGKANVIEQAAGLTMASQTFFDMSSSGCSQIIGNLVAQSASDLNKARINIGSNTLTLNTTQASVFNGIVYGNGTVVKAGQGAQVQTLGFYLSDTVKFNGKIDVQEGTLRTNTDVFATALTGNVGTFFDINDKTFTITTSGDTVYDGLLISSASTVGSGTFIKQGSGTFTTGFSNATGTSAFNGSVNVVEGNLKLNSNWIMEGGDGNTLSFTIDNLLGSTPSVIDLQLDNGNKGKATFTSGTKLEAIVNSGTSWQLASGEHTVGIIRASADSVFSSHTAAQLALDPSQNDTILSTSDSSSLFYGVGKRIETDNYSYQNLRVVVNVTGIGGVATTRNAREVGNNLDSIRVSTSVPTGLDGLIQAIWNYGSNDVRESNRAKKQAEINSMLTALSGDTLANSMYIGLSRPWRTPFDRLSLDAQMYYPSNGYNAPQGYRGQSVANMNNVWFRAFSDTMDVDSDGNARAFGISRQGFTLGYDRRIAQNASAGLVFGYSTPYLYQNEDRVRAADFQVGAYAGAMIGYYFELKGYIGYGHQNYESSRVFVTPDLALADSGAVGGIRDPRMASHASFGGDTFSFSLELSRPLFFGICILRPTIALDSEHVFRGNFNEVGDAIALSYKNADFHRTMGRFGASIETSTFDRFKIRGRMFYGFLLGGDDYAISSSQFMNTAALTTQTAHSVAIGTSYFDAGIGMQLYLNPQKTFAMYFDYDASMTDKMANNLVSVGFNIIY